MRLYERGRRRIGRLLRREPGYRPALDAALGWLRRQTLPGSGIAVSSREPTTPYPEVSGYLIPTLRAWGEHELALQYGRWLVATQRPDGAWTDAAQQAPYTFDTGQILKGLLALGDRLPEAEAAVRAGCDWMLTRIRDDGRVTTPDTSHWALPGGREVPEAIHLYALEPLIVAGERLGEPRYQAAAARALRFYLKQPGLTAFDTLSHFHAYVIEALVDLGEPQRALEGMRRIETCQRRDGRIPGYAGVGWTCSTAVAQYAVVWYKLGRREPAERALEAMRRLQEPTGGFRGSRGRAADYFPRAEIPWAAKYFLDALWWHVRTAFDAEADSFPDAVGEGDGRLRLLAAVVAEGEPRRVLDAGCGAGRFARRLLERFPSLELHGVDLSPAMLRRLPGPVRPAVGSLLDLPYPDAHFDLVYCIEALEHAVNVAAAIRELARVVAPGGTLLIIDKNREARDAHGLRPSAWESWFSAGEIESLLRQAGFQVTVQDDLPYDDRDGRDGLFLGWVARHVP